MRPLVEVRGLTKIYRRGSETIEVLHGVDLDIARGDFVALMGPSGSGKTTLLNLIGGLDRPTAGTIEIEAGASTARQRRAGAVARRQRRLRVPVLQSAAGPDGAAERRAAAAAHGAAAAERRRRAAIALSSSASRTARATGRRSCRAGRSSASRSRARSCPIRRCSSATSPRATSTAPRPTRFCAAPDAQREHGKTIVMVTHDPKAAEHARRQLDLDKGSLVE